MLNKGIAGSETDEFGLPSITLTQRRDLDTPAGLYDLTGELLTGRVPTSYWPRGYEFSTIFDVLDV